MKGRPLTDAEKARIQEAVDAGFRRGDLARLAQEMGRPVNTLSAYLARRGHQPLRRAWTRQELAILEAHLRESPRQIRAALLASGFDRSVDSITWQIRRIGAPRHPDADGNYSANLVAQGLGVTHDTVGAWIRRGWLVASRANSQEQCRGLAWTITPAALCDFLVEYISYLDHRRFDKWFWTDIVSRRSSQRQVTMPETGRRKMG